MWGKRKIPWLLCFAVIITVVAVMFRDQLTLASFVEREAALRTHYQEQPVLVYGCAFLLYVIVTGLSLPGASVMSLAYGWFFRFWPALLLVSFASTTGATLSFLMSRLFFRDMVQQRFGTRLVKLNAAWERDGPLFLFTLRLIPAVPFFVINVVMGLTPIRTATFYWVSQLGMLPGTMVYVYAGSTVGSLAELSERGARGVLTWQTVIACLLLGSFPWLVKWGLSNRLRPENPVH